MPDAVELCVMVDDRVKGGETVIAKYDRMIPAIPLETSAADPVFANG